MLDRTRQICIIDQNDDMVDALKLLLSDLDAEFLVFADAESFLAHMQDGVPLPVILIVEFSLPGVSGLDLYESLRSRGIDLPTVVTATDAPVSVAVRAIRAGVLDYYEKPFIEPRLRNLVSSVLEGQTGC